MEHTFEIKDERVFVIRDRKTFKVLERFSYKDEENPFLNKDKLTKITCIIPVWSPLSDGFYKTPININEIIKQDFIGYRFKTYEDAKLVEDNLENEVDILVMIFDLKYERWIPAAGILELEKEKLKEGILNKTIKVVWNKNNTLQFINSQYEKQIETDEFFKSIETVEFEKQLMTFYDIETKKQIFLIFTQ